MTELTNLRPIKGITYGGPVQNGHGIAFRVEFEGGELENYYCRSDQLPLIIGSLLSFGNLAEQIRGGKKKGEIEVATPYTVAKIANSGHSDDRKTIAIEIATKQGFPLQIAMSPGEARKTIEFLQRELTAVALPQPPDRRN